jgi:hypothetical protein
MLLCVTVFITFTKYRSPNAKVAQTKSRPSGVNSTIELENVTATSYENCAAMGCYAVRNCISLSTILGKWPAWRTIHFYVFISILYMFRAPRAHHQENQLYQYNIWYMSLCVGDCFVCRSVPACTQNGHRHRVTHTRCCIDTIDSPDNEHEVLETCRELK